MEMKSVLRNLVGGLGLFALVFGGMIGCETNGGGGNNFEPTESVLLPPPPPPVVAVLPNLTGRYEGTFFLDQKSTDPLLGDHGEIIAILTEEDVGDAVFTYTGEAGLLFLGGTIAGGPPGTFIVAVPARFEGLVIDENTVLFSVPTVLCAAPPEEEATILDDGDTIIGPFTEYDSSCVIRRTGTFEMHRVDK